MELVRTKFNDVFIIEPPIYSDSRGFFMESYTLNKFLSASIEYTFLQDNHSSSSEAGTIRGLHYQVQPKAQTKLVRVLSGAIYDVIVDIRKTSVTYGQWQGFILSESNHRQLIVPKGFAHGFCTLVPNTQVFYKVDEYYSPEHDRGIMWNDPFLGIDWPVSNPHLSVKDQNHPKFLEAEHFE